MNKSHLIGLMISLCAPVALWAQNDGGPPRHGDCWKIEEKYCWEEYSHHRCDNLSCIEKWVEIQVNPDKIERVRTWHCQAEGGVSVIGNTNRSWTARTALSTDESVGRIVIRADGPVEVFCGEGRSCGCSGPGDCDDLGRIPGADFDPHDHWTVSELGLPCRRLVAVVPESIGENNPSDDDQ